MKKHILQEEWESIVSKGLKELNWWSQKEKELKKRNIKLLQATGNGQVYRNVKLSHARQSLSYEVHLNLLLDQNGKVFMEEHVIPFTVEMNGNEITTHSVLSQVEEPSKQEGKFTPNLDHSDNDLGLRGYVYDRRKAVQYAERWWNDYNPNYHKFENDCTNFISQCLHAGGAPMSGKPNRGKGWWYSGTNWSYSWAVANALRWYLSSANNALRSKEVEKAQDLMPGDVICYDFEGDGQWNHNTMVVAKDAYGEPLVNAHTYNTRMRSWHYEDSPAYTSNIQYKFFSIG